MASEINLASLIRKRSAIKSRITRFETFLSQATPDNSNLFELERKRDSCANSLVEFENIQLDIEALDGTENDEIADFENHYYSVIVSLDTLISTMTKNARILQTQSDSSNAPIAGQNAPSDSQFKLPPINLPKFDGNSNAWLSFIETFNVLVHANDAISDLFKLQHLKNCLTGEPRHLIDSLTLSESNYAIAYELLTNRYQNKLVIVKTNIQSLFTLPPVSKNSPSSLRNLIDRVSMHLKVLKTLNLPTECWDVLIIYLITTKLDVDSNLQWETQLSLHSNKDIPSLQEMTDFLTKRCQLLESLHCGTKSTPSSSQTNSNAHSQPNRTFTLAATKSNSPSCPYCKGNHAIIRCTAFLELPVPRRVDEVKRMNLCPNCLYNHKLEQCKSRFVCKQCQNRHHTLIHIQARGPPENTRPVPPALNPNVPNFQPTASTSAATNLHCLNSTASHVLLSTAEVDIIDGNSQLHRCRVLLDAGSQINLISSSFFSKLGLPARNKSIPIIGIDGTTSHVTKISDVTFKSVHNSYKHTIQCAVISNITQNVPTYSFDKKLFQIPHNIKLADEDFHTSKPVDMLLGAECFWGLLCVGQIKQSKEQPYFHKTKLGWVIGGTLTLPNSNTIDTRDSRITACATLQNQLAKFWELEDCTQPSKGFDKYDKCEQHFQNTHAINPEGRFVVQLPFVSEKPVLGSSRTLALRRFNSLEAKFLRQPVLKTDYQKFIHEYIDLKHMSLLGELSSFDSSASEHYFLPHHAVVKTFNSEPKLRVVFDASAKTSNGISLNETLLVGPTIQETLANILLRFRMHKYVIIADIKKMYRQMLVHPNDRPYQLILWRDHPTETVKIYQLNTITYGTASAPFLATRCLQEALNIEQYRYPLAHATFKDFYVDNLLTGAPTKGILTNIRDHTIAALKAHGFELSQWASNSRDLLPCATDTTDQSEQLVQFFDDDVSTLGLLWSPTRDSFKFFINDNSLSQKRASKRSILSMTAQIFDPLGLVAPVTVIPKLILQRLWSLKVNWDESIPVDLDSSWKRFYSQIHILRTLSIPRSVLSNTETIQYELHGFCDASERAYGCCVYLRSLHADVPHSLKLICSKSRVAPLKSCSLPRLELCGAVLLATLFHNVANSLDIQISRTFLWTDSQIVLAWLAKEPGTWKTFVANRTAEILSLTNANDWHYINSRNNPADIISRGLTPSQLINSTLWWKGPEFLTLDETEWPNTNAQPISTTLPETKPLKALVARPKALLPVFTKFSKFSKLQRVIAYCLRFIHNRVNKNAEPLHGSLTCNELQHATNVIIRKIQSHEFHREIKDLKTSSQVDNRSKLKSLNPFLDQLGLIRVGGRLVNATLQYDKKHPAVLPKHFVTNLIIKEAHQSLLHSGNQATLHYLRQKYWPLDGRNVVRRVIHGCLRCYRANPQPGNQLMGNLPNYRVEPARPFVNSGVDFAGPILIKDGSGRGYKSRKAYIALFKCLATKAVHIELVNDLTTEAFLNSLKRCISRRGHIANLYSDNATNFIGASRELRKLQALFASQNHSMFDGLHANKIVFHNIPPRASHFGGIWEAGIKSIKNHLKRVIGETILSYEEMYTLLVRIEACINSRPLIPLSNDPNDLQALTPAHFLIGETFTSFAEPDLAHLKLNRLSRWQLLERLRQHFWKRWSTEYLTNLHERNKWQFVKNQIALNTVVVLKEDNQPPLSWPLGIVVELHPGRDGITRVVSVKTANGIFKRSTTKVCAIPEQ